jgi:hypothetical protein
MLANGRVFNISENRTWWKNALREARIRDFSWRDLPHTFCSRLAQAGNEFKGYSGSGRSQKYFHVREICPHGSDNTPKRTVSP